MSLRELEALLAQHVMGWTGGDWRTAYMHPPGEKFYAPVPHYLTDIAAAFMVIEKVRGSLGCHDDLGPRLHAGLAGVTRQRPRALRRHVAARMVPLRHLATSEHWSGH
jgi:hypothetical protein